MKIGFGSDHAAAGMKDMLLEYLSSKGYECVDFGANDPNVKVDYPVKALAVAQAVRRGDVDRGVLCCGTGIGVSLAANKVPGIRAAVCGDPFSAKMAACHNDANIICLGARVLGDELAKVIVDAYFDASFEGGRHARRVAMISDIEAEYGAKWHE